MKKLLEEKYRNVQKMCNIAIEDRNQNINTIIQKSIKEFIGKCNVPAIWCYGKHTKMLMTDFMFELKKVHYIIDNGIEKKVESGFEIINESDLISKNIDGVIISSRIYKDEIIARLEEKYDNIRYLDIYEELEKAGISLAVSYYAMEHPYSKYCNLNKLQRDLCKERDKNICPYIIKKIIRQYIEIKDFYSAIKYTKKLFILNNDEWTEKLLLCLVELYELQLKVLTDIDSNNVVMLCIDGLRRQDVCVDYMKNLCDYLYSNTYFFSNAYSLSTSTFESLIPAYSENTDLRTRYYELNSIAIDNCRFMKEAKRQKRNIYFYTDGTSYISDKEIKMIEKSQTATEKLWSFLLDVSDEKNGLFYIHILYESHYSYPNPYTLNELVADGMSIWFDYLDRNGGKIRTDYNRQKNDSLKYLDDVIVPLIKNISCRMVVYADHGNIIINPGTTIDEIEKSKFTFHKDLIQIPFAIKSPEMPIKQNKSLTSLIELNNILIGLLNQKKIILRENEFIKVLRSEIYNPDFKYLYEKVNYGHGLLAFELFIFESGYELVIFSDGTIEVYLTEKNIKIDNLQIKQELLEKVRDKVTVCNLKRITSEVHRNN